MNASPVATRYIRYAALARTAETATARDNAAYEAAYVGKMLGAEAVAALAPQVDAEVATAGRHLKVVR